MELRGRVSEIKLDIVGYRERLQRLELENKDLNAEVADKKTFEQIKQTIALKDETINELKGKM